MNNLVLDRLQLVRNVGKLPRQLIDPAAGLRPAEISMILFSIEMGRLHLAINERFEAHRVLTAAKESCCMR